MIDTAYLEKKGITQRDIIIVVLSLIIAYLVIYRFVTTFDWEFADWSYVYHPAAQSPLHPYVNDSYLKYMNTPWFAWLLSPLGLLPVRAALALWIEITIIVSIWSITKLDGDLYTVILAILSPGFVRLIISGQIDVVSLAGFALLFNSKWFVQGMGIVLMMIKPQALGVRGVSVLGRFGKGRKNQGFDAGNWYSITLLSTAWLLATSPI